MKISIIIPTLNEAKALPLLLPQLLSEGVEVLVVDGGSTDSTVEIAKQFPVKVLSSPPGRAIQMNAGAAQARGNLLWFLHADTEVPANWKGQLLHAFSDPEVIGGAFRVVIDAPGVGYRLLDLWGRIRPYLQRSFYGDQGIFVRREIFKRLGGFPDRPILEHDSCKKGVSFPRKRESDPPVKPEDDSFARLVLEDVDFSSRLWRQGKVVLLPGSLRTSARRWQQQGFWRTVFHHSRLALKGVACPPQSEPRGRRGSTWHLGIAVVVMAKVPVPGQVKTRLVPPLTYEQAAALARKLLQETVTLVRGLKGVQPSVAVSPPEGIGQVKELLCSGRTPCGDSPLTLIPQTDGDLGRRIDEVFSRSFRDGFQGVIVLGADHPNLPARYLIQAVEILQRETDPVVLGPTEDGGYYLMGLTRPHPELFQGVPWSTPDVLRITLEKAKGNGLSVTLLPPWFDIDRPDDLARFQDRL